ncbi:SIMPL domain-containing protein [Erythrobacter sp.]|uniref:SIMPL domain-containing protein n=1 Tax=Erythrobacter sp. TaxID=1042 RepID=UPI001425D04E|nr:SIMPL domain-containing protein [Erythrobacter sp.]QIQ86546.1 MAG: SIMPL domain-containing protein [Erythrobacter sp.]
MKTAITSALAAGLLAATATAAAPAAAANVEIEAEGPVIELGVYESITAEPDIVTVGAGVTTEAATAVEAMRQNADAMTRVIDRIKALGVKEKDIQTTGINLSPRYDYDRENRKQVFRGYTVSNRVSVKLREIEGTGDALDALVAAGATDISGPNFGLDDDTQAKDAARERAIERAGERARAYAAMLGYDEVRVLQINESIQGRGPAPASAMRAMDAESISVSATPVQPGMVETGVSIAITYELVDDEAED